jgi:hypothetical protein
MKKLIPLLLLFTGCASVKFVQTDHGQIVNEHNQPIHIAGNPRITCFDVYGKVIADGYYVRKLDNGSIVVDEFGKRYMVVPHPVCQLGSNLSPQN